MKKFILSAFVILAFTAYSLNQKTGAAIVSAPVTNLVVAVPQISNSMPMGRMMNNGKYRNGTYAGDSVYAYSDYVQISAVITGGRLTDVQFSGNTGGPNRSQQIYSYAMPKLKSEAISAQSASVDTISGATYTSEAFRQSLASALAQAVI